MKITFVIPCRNNLRYLRQAVDSITRHYGETHDIIILDDASTDNTYEWMCNIASTSSNIMIYRNDSGERVGHTVLYDIGIQMAKTDVVTILHSDMVVTRGYVENLTKHLSVASVVSATRIEPPLHPPGPEKIVRNFGIEPEEFDQKAFDEFVEIEIAKNAGHTTLGIFAPWICYKEDFMMIGGHDKLFAPMELEDSDIFNRFLLAGYNLVQSRDAFVYHMTCRGSRFKDGVQIEAEIPLPDGTVWYKPKDSEEYKQLRAKKFREWYRKWHSDVLHDSNMMPIVVHVYDTSIIVRNCTLELLAHLEPFSDRIYVDCDIDIYVKTETPNTMYDLRSRVFKLSDVKNYQHSLLIEIDGSQYIKEFEKNSTYLRSMGTIIEDSIDEVGTYQFECFTVKLTNLNPKSVEELITPVIENVFSSYWKI